MIHQESVIKVDFIIRKSSEYRRIEFERRQKIKVQDFTTYIVSKEDLIISKLFWMKETGSEIQSKDIKNLAATGYDSKYLEIWTNKLGLDILWKEHST